MKVRTHTRLLLLYILLRDLKFLPLCVKYTLTANQTHLFNNSNT